MPGDLIAKHQRLGTDVPLFNFLVRGFVNDLAGGITTDALHPVDGFGFRVIDLLPRRGKTVRRVPVQVLPAVGDRAAAHHFRKHRGVVDVVGKVIRQDVEGIQVLPFRGVRLEFGAAPRHRGLQNFRADRKTPLRTFLISPVRHVTVRIPCFGLQRLRGREPKRAGLREVLTPPADADIPAGQGQRHRSERIKIVQPERLAESGGHFGVLKRRDVPRERGPRKRHLRAESPLRVGGRAGRGIDRPGRAHDVAAPPIPALPGKTLFGADRGLGENIFCGIKNGNVKITAHIIIQKTGVRVQDRRVGHRIGLETPLKDRPLNPGHHRRLAAEGVHSPGRLIFPRVGHGITRNRFGIPGRESRRLTGHGIMKLLAKQFCLEKSLVSESRTGHLLQQDDDLGTERPFFGNVVLVVPAFHRVDHLPVRVNGLGDQLIGLARSDHVSRQLVRIGPAVAHIVPRDRPVVDRRFVRKSEGGQIMLFLDRIRKLVRKTVHKLLRDAVHRGERVTVSVPQGQNTVLDVFHEAPGPAQAVRDGTVAARPLVARVRPALGLRVLRPARRVADGAKVLFPRWTGGQVLRVELDLASPDARLDIEIPFTDRLGGARNLRESLGQGIRPRAVRACPGVAHILPGLRHHQIGAVVHIRERFQVLRFLFGRQIIFFSRHGRLGNAFRNGERECPVIPVNIGILRYEDPGALLVQREGPGSVGKFPRITEPLLVHRHRNQDHVVGILQDLKRREKPGVLGVRITPVSRKARERLAAGDKLLDVIRIDPRVTLGN
ncbi:MAG: hypothetical protein BWY49_00533 [Candidatus Omnitrophica bacterium ADurb.Bin314]|nr:MAG: hypothetical protein BWY49_00533 [Candidatus Omnitrophica bacterium ADurb.Bin314]